MRFLRTARLSPAANKFERPAANIMSNGCEFATAPEIKSCLAVVDELVWRPDDCQSVIDDYWRDRVALPALLADKIFRVLVRRTKYAIAGRQVPTWRIMYAIARRPTMWPAIAADLLVTLENMVRAICRDTLAGRVDLDKQLSWEGEAVSRPARQSETAATADDGIAGQTRALMGVCDGYTASSTPEELLDHMRILGSDLLAHPAVLRNLDACLELALAGAAFSMNAGKGDGSLCTLPAWKILRALAERPDLAPQLRAVFIDCIRQILVEHAEQLEKD